MDLQLDGQLKLSDLGINPSDVVQSPGGVFWDFADGQTNQGPFDLLSVSSKAG